MDEGPESDSTALVGAPLEELTDPARGILVCAARLLIADGEVELDVAAVLDLTAEGGPSTTDGADTSAYRLEAGTLL